MSVATPNPRVGSPALFLSLIIAAALAYIFVTGTLDLDEDLYVLSKSFAPYEVRQYLGMSKRYLLQYAHIGFLFCILVFSKYAYVGDRGAGVLDPTIRVIHRYWLPVFLFHFPLLYLMAAIPGYDKTSGLHQGGLLIGCIAGSVLIGRLCYGVKPWFDRIQMSVLGRWRTGSATREAGGPRSDLTVTSEHSRFLDLLKLFAALGVVLGHFSFTQFSTVSLPFMPGHAPRFVIPVFFILSGYLTMLSLERSPDGFLANAFRRYWSLMFVVVPMLLIVPILDQIGFAMNPDLYGLHPRFSRRETGSAVTIGEFLLIAAASVTFLNEILAFNFAGVLDAQGGMRAFSNDAFWYLCYLVPFTIALTAIVKLRGWRRIGTLGVMVLVFGGPIMISSPMFFAGALAYLFHKRF